MKFSWKSYYQPTPKNIRKWADGILAACTFLTGLAIYNDYKEIAIGVAVAGTLSKLLSNFFSENES